MMNAEISNEMLLVDIANTEKECQAYLKIAEGFDVLCSLPENNNKLDIRLHAQRYRNNYAECCKLLAKLKKIATERGLKS